MKIGENKLLVNCLSKTWFGVREDKLDHTFYYELTFNKSIENYQNPNINLSGFNMNAGVHKFYKDGGTVINYYLKVGDKKIEKKIRLKRC